MAIGAASPRTYHRSWPPLGLAAEGGAGWHRPLPPPLLAVVGCTYSEREPGLLTAMHPSRLSGRRAVRASYYDAPPGHEPELPVAGEAVWTSADGWDVQVRFAVHAVRRVDGGTVLDWSVTPIRAPNLRPGDDVPDSVDLGLSRWWESSANVSWSTRGDGRSTGRCYAPPDSDYCLCTPIWMSQQPPDREYHFAAGGVPRATGCPAYGRCGHPDRAPVLAGPRHAGWPGPARQPSHGPDAARRGSPPSSRQVGHVPLRPEQAGVSGTGPSGDCGRHLHLAGVGDRLGHRRGRRRRRRPRCSPARMPRP